MGKLFGTDDKKDRFYENLSHLLTAIIDLRGLLERVSIEIAKKLDVKQAFIFVYHSENDARYVSAGTRNHAKMPLEDVRLLDRVGRDIIVTDKLSANTAVKRMLRSHKIELVLSLRRGSETVGYLFLGDRKKGSYGEHDKRLLQIISGELVIAVQNALSLHELQELNATLQQRIDVATKELRSSNAQLMHLDEVKDEFISMASHQLRTPLTSVKGYVSMVLEGDAGPISPQQRKLLLEAFDSSERMVRLIADFLSVSRLQTGKFIVEKQPIDIAKITKQEVDSLRVIAEGREISLKLEVTREQLPLMADEAKVRQVVMNFIDNAIFYSKAGSTVTVLLKRDHDDVLFAVTDQGIGVPEAEQPKLFGKFFRAKNARKQRPDGTGVGLYLAKKVITDHEGKIIFHSEEGKGSTFGFRLPLGEDIDNADNNDHNRDKNTKSD